MGFGTRVCIARPLCQKKPIKSCRENHLDPGPFVRRLPPMNFCSVLFPSLLPVGLHAAAPPAEIKRDIDQDGKPD